MTTSRQGSTCTCSDCATAMNARHGTDSTSTRATHATAPRACRTATRAPAVHTNRSGTSCVGSSRTQKPCDAHYLSDKRTASRQHTLAALQSPRLKDKRLREQRLASIFSITRTNGYARRSTSTSCSSSYVAGFHIQLVKDVCPSLTILSTKGLAVPWIPLPPDRPAPKMSPTFGGFLYLTCPPCLPVFWLAL